MPIPIMLDFTDVPDEFGWKAPLGPYQTQITSAKLTDNNSVGYAAAVTQGPHAGNELFFYMRLPTGDPKKDRGIMIEWKQMLRAYNVPENNLVGPSAFDAEQMINAQGVVYRDEHEWDGKIHPDTYFVKPLDVPAALAGTWKRKGGSSVGQAQVTPAAVPADPGTPAPSLAAGFTPGAAQPAPPVAPVAPVAAQLMAQPVAQPAVQPVALVAPVAPVQPVAPTAPPAGGAVNSLFRQ